MEYNELTESQKQAICKEINCDSEELEGLMEEYKGDYLVLTDEEADEKVKEYIKESVWAFNASFLSSETGLPEDMFTAVQPQCESANDAVLQCIEQSCGLDEFVESAVSADGRGHFLSSYDGNEIEVNTEEETLYIYRIN